MAIKDEHYVIDFEHIDDFRCQRSLREAVTDPHTERPDYEELGRLEKELHNELHELFLEAGWEGDGEIGCIFLPPCFSSREDGWCDIIYHVKQSNNGTSWLAIPNDLKLSLPEGHFAKRP